MLKNKISSYPSHQGAWVTATDLPDVLNNLNFNLSRNTRGRCRYTPQVAALTWGQDATRHFPSSVYRYDYVLCADVVYHHDFLEDLLITMKHFCKPGTTLLWANKVRLHTRMAHTEVYGLEYKSHMPSSVNRYGHVLDMLFQLTYIFS